MECPNCHATSPQTNVFCPACGAQLQGDAGSTALDVARVRPKRCTSCLEWNAPASRFCTQCGTLLPASPPALLATDLPLPPALLATDLPLPIITADERRLVTVLHADLCSFTPMAEKMTPEQTKILLDALFDALTREITALGGQVNAYIGDAILAIFGVPVSHGDDPQRAAKAALALQKVIGVFSHPLLQTIESRLAMRIGLDSGPVVVGQVGASRKITVTGASLANAMELESAAPQGGILVSHTLYQQLYDEFELEPYTEVTKKKAYQLHAIAAHAQVPAPDTPAPETALPGIDNGTGTDHDTRRGHGTTRADDSGTEGGSRSVVASGPDARGLASGTDVRAVGSGTEDRSVASATDARALPADPSQQAYRRPQINVYRSQVQARIDQLPVEERRIIKLASIAGPHFWRELLERMAGASVTTALSALESKGLIRPIVHTAIPHAAEFEFTEREVRDVAYNNNLKKVRQFFHLVVATWLRENAEDDINFAKLLAHQYAAGGAPLTAARVLMTAAGRASVLQSTDEIADQYRAAIRLATEAADTDPEGQSLVTQCRQALAKMDALEPETA